MRILSRGLLVGVLVVLFSCSSTKYMDEGDYLLDKVSISADSSVINVSSLEGYIRQQPNSSWLGRIKVPLGIYLMAPKGSKSAMSRFLRRMGEAPVVYDTLISQRSSQRIRDAVFNMGYLHATVETGETFHKHKVRVNYRVHPGTRYYVDSLRVIVADTILSRELDKVSSQSLLHVGMPLDANVLNQERSRLSNHFANIGYYAFNRDFVRFEVDTIQGSNRVGLRMYVTDFVDPTTKAHRPHQAYRIGKVEFAYDRSTGSPIWLRESVLSNSCSLSPDSLYRESDVSETYSRLNRLASVAATNVRMTPSDEDSSRLDAKIVITPSHLNSITLGLDGTNTAGDLGAAVNLTYQNRNVFHGSEMFSLKLRTAFEAIRGLKGYADQNYFEYGVDAGLQFPNFIFPFLSKKFRRQSQATTEFGLNFASQDRPEFHRRVLAASWKYRWNNANPKYHHRVELIDINYVFMPWISDTFYETYIKDPESRNAIIAYNYKNLFIVRLGYQYQYSSAGLSSPMGIYGKNAYTLSFGIETAGNVVHGLCSLFGTKVNDDGQRTLFDIAYAQYVKADFEYCRSFRLSNRTSLALHCAFGIAYPYGNSDILPYEKRYFSGGANSVRGWSVRSLGPGSFQGNDGNIDFINQTGDVKLDLNVELRVHLFWKFDGAIFVDAGNIWTLRDYKDQPGGQFRFDTCWRQIAASYGLGIRLNLNYFLLRLDAGMKAINPAFDDTKRHYPLIYPNFNRDFALHFAVGLPF